jgi:hypothetical protein
MTHKNTQPSNPGIYPNENEIIPYSPRSQFRFMENVTNDKTIKLESMRHMSIDQIVELYKNGFTIENMYQASQNHASTIVAATNDVTVSSDVIFLIGAGILVYMFIKKK